MKSLLAFLLTLLVLPAGLARAEELVVPKTVELWPEGAPAARGSEPADRPTITIYQPSVRFNKKCAVIVCPGGGYGGHAMGHEGAEIAGWLNSLRSTAFVLKYRLAPYQHPVPMHDVQRAIRHVRANAEEYGIDPEKIGVLGFSAGGHLASTAVTHFDDGNSDSSDPIDQQSCRPDFGILCYPVITMKSPTTHGGSKKNLLGTDPPEDLVELMSNELQVTEETPPTFLFHTFEDTAVPPLNSVLFYQAMIEHKVPGELHIFQSGRHGVGLGRNIPATNAWSTLAENWMRANSWID